MRACSLGLVGLGFTIRDRVGVRVRDGVRVSTFLARDVIYTSRAYATMSVSVCMSVCV